MSENRADNCTKNRELNLPKPLLARIVQRLLAFFHKCMCDLLVCSETHCRQTIKATGGFGIYFAPSAAMASDFKNWFFMFSGRLVDARQWSAAWLSLYAVYQ